MALDFSDLQRGLRVRGLVATHDVTIIAVEPHGDTVANVVFRNDDGQIGDTTRRVVVENAGQLNAKSNEFEQ